MVVVRMVAEAAGKLNGYLNDHEDLVMLLIITLIMWLWGAVQMVVCIVKGMVGLGVFSFCLMIPFNVLILFYMFAGLCALVAHIGGENG